MGLNGQWFNSIIFKQLLVAPDAIALDNFLTCLFYMYHLWLQPQGKHCCMSQTIFCLEEILVDKVVMWHMAIITVGLFSM
jgi:hypothetical protein